MKELLRGSDSPERRIEKLERITAALMSRVESSGGGSAFASFQTAAALEAKVRARTQDLESALSQLNQSRARLDRARSEAEQARADLAAALEAVREGFALFGGDGRLIMSNSRFARVFPDLHDKITPGLDLDDYFQLVSQSAALIPSEGLSRSAWLSERRRRHDARDASFILELTRDRWIQVAEQSTPNGGTAILQTEVTDMVLRERNERAKLLDAQAQLVRATLDHMDQGVVTFDSDHQLIGWNIRLLDLLPLPARMMQRGADFSQLARHLHENEVFPDPEKAKRIADWVRQPDNAASLRDELRTRTGMHLAVAARAMPDGGFVISFTDVTAEREAQRAQAEANETLEARVRLRTKEMESARDDALRADQAKTRFLAAASHDLLQPLNAAKLFLASVDRPALPPREASLMGRIESAFSSVETLLRALLDIARLDGAPAFRKEPIALGGLFASIANDYRETARQKGLALRHVASSATVLSDPVYLQRIVQNLVVNAITHTRAGKVVFGARHLADGRLRIEVWDTGPGIPEGQQQRIFDDFHRIDTGPDMEPGMGLGLAIVRRASTLLGHELALESCPGRGTVFKVTLEKTARKGPGDAPHQTGEAARSFSDMIVLVIENEPDVRDALVTLLDQWGLSPLPAASLGEAERLIAEIGVAPDVILADYQLEDNATGLAAISALRRSHGEIRAMLITANHEDELKASAAALSVPVLHKPVHPMELRDWLSRPG